MCSISTRVTQTVESHGGQPRTAGGSFRSALSALFLCNNSFAQPFPVSIPAATPSAPRGIRQAMLRAFVQHQFPRLFGPIVYRPRRRRRAAACRLCRALPAAASATASPRPARRKSAATATTTPATWSLNAAPGDDHRAAERVSHHHCRPVPGGPQKVHAGQQVKSALLDVVGFPVVHTQRRNALPDKFLGQFGVEARCRPAEPPRAPHTQTTARVDSGAACRMAGISPRVVRSARPSPASPSCGGPTSTCSIRISIAPPLITPYASSSSQSSSSSSSLSKSDSPGVSGSSRGRVIIISVYSPGSDSTTMAPPCSRMMSLQIERPRPVPCRWAWW